MTSTSDFLVFICLVEPQRVFSLNLCLGFRFLTSTVLLSQARPVSPPWLFTAQRSAVQGRLEDTGGVRLAAAPAGTCREV